MLPRTIADTIKELVTRKVDSLPAPAYIPDHRAPRSELALVVESMRRHMTDEGWQIMDGLAHAGYLLAGYNIPMHDLARCAEYPSGLTDVAKILEVTNPTTVVVQDKREWDVSPRDFRELRAKFTNVDALARRPDVFKLTILKDSHQRPDYHATSATEVGCHAWVIYYHPRIVYHLAPYVRPQHLVRTYHSIDKNLVPSIDKYTRAGCLLSGAISAAYPLRGRLVRRANMLPALSYLKHPGYHRSGCATPQFLDHLSHFKVSICTSSVFGYSLRKIIESTACGCVVITDLPTDEVLPLIDDNLIRIHPSIAADEVASMLHYLYKTYDQDRQHHYATLAKEWYDYRAVGTRLAADIVTMKDRYSCP
jgi:hypothetical protein